MSKSSTSHRSRPLYLTNQPELYSEGRLTEDKEGSPLTDFKTSPGARALLDVSSTPDVSDVDELVVTEVAADWERVALRLGVEGCVSEAVLKNHPNDCRGACQDMLDRWLRRDPHTGEEEWTWSTLLTALGRSGFEELERRLRREHFHKAISPLHLTARLACVCVMVVVSFLSLYTQQCVSTVMFSSRIHDGHFVVAMYY